jgi:uncharacterized membrane protein
MFELSIRIDRPIATVFATVANVEAAPRWYSAVTAVAKLSSGGIGRGSRYSFTREIAGRKVENIVEVTEFVDGARLTLSSVSGPTPFTYRYRVEADGAATRLELAGTISGAGLGGPVALLAPLASHFFENGMRANLGNLKRLIEDQPRAH